MVPVCHGESQWHKITESHWTQVSVVNSLVLEICCSDHLSSFVQWPWVSKPPGRDLSSRLESPNPTSARLLAHSQGSAAHAGPSVKQKKSQVKLLAIGFFCSLFDPILFSDDFDRFEIFLTDLRYFCYFKFQVSIESTIRFTNRRAFSSCSLATM